MLSTANTVIERALNKYPRWIEFVDGCSVAPWFTVWFTVPLTSGFSNLAAVNPPPRSAVVDAPRGAVPAEARVPLAIPAMLVALFAIRLALLPWLGLFNDEAYYWEWSRRLGASYYDHPPLVAWVLAASTALFGRTALAVHLPALVCTALTSAVLYRLSLDLLPGRRGVAWGAVLLCNAAPLFALGAVFTTPDAPAVLAWALTAWLSWRAVNGAPRLWYLAGAAAGVGLLAKYSNVLLPLAIFLFLLRPRHRSWLRRKEPYLAFGIMLLCFAPVVLWNARHGWESFLYQLVERHGGAFRPWRTVARFLVAQQSLSPLVWAACVAGAVRSWRAARAGSEAHAFVLTCAAVILGFFGAFSLFTYVNPNWIGPGFLTLMIPAAELLTSSRSRLLRVAPAALGVALSLLFYVQAVTLWVPLPPKTDFATDLVGWDEVGAKLRELEATLPRDPAPFVFSRRLQLSALAAFYGGDALDVTRIGGRRDQYDEWNTPERRRGRNAIYFCDDQKWATPELYPFARCEPVGELPIVRRGRAVRRFWFWRCYGYAP